MKCKQDFSVIMSIETKTRNSLVLPFNDFRCAVGPVSQHSDGFTKRGPGARKVRGHYLVFKAKHL